MNRYFCHYENFWSDLLWWIPQLNLSFGPWSSNNSQKSRVKSYLQHEIWEAALLTFLGDLKAKFSRGPIFFKRPGGRTNQPDMLDQKSGTPLEWPHKLEFWFWFLKIDCGLPGHCRPVSKVRWVWHHILFKLCTFLGKTLIILELPYTRPVRPARPFCWQVCSSLDWSYEYLRQTFWGSIRQVWAGKNCLNSSRTTLN